MKLTNSITNRTASVSDRISHERTVKSIQHGPSIYSPEALELRKIIDSAALSDAERHNLALEAFSELGAERIFSKEYLYHLTHSPLGGFELSMLMLTNAVGMGAREDALNFLALAKHRLVAGMEQKPKRKDIRYARGSIQLFVFNLDQLLRSEFQTRAWLRIFIEKAYEFVDFLDVYENILQDRVLYLDDNIAITWYRGPHNPSKKFKTTGEVTIAVKAYGLWSFDKYLGVRIPISSIRKAREACRNWKGHTLKGHITHHEAERIARFLGFEIKEKMAILRPARQRLTGFNSAPTEKKPRQLVRK